MCKNTTDIKTKRNATNTLMSLNFKNLVKMDQFLERYKLSKKAQAEFYTQFEFPYINLKSWIHN